MITKQNLEKEIKNLNGLNDMILAYEEIAAGRIKQSRDSVLLSRTYMDSVNQVFVEVISSYKSQVESMMKRKRLRKADKYSFLNKNGRTLNLLISANTGLYGNIVKRTFDLFVDSYKKNPNCDLAIIGKLGQAMWNEADINAKISYFDFPDQSVDKVKLKEILNFLISYERVVVFYGQFQNLVKQQETLSEISGTSRGENITSKSTTKYFFEPSLAKVLEFFEKQIFSSIFEQTVRESQLSKIASRLTTLDKASENIDLRLKGMTSEKNRSIHQIQNKKQLQTFSSRVLWQR